MNETIERLVEVGCDAIVGDEVGDRQVEAIVRAVLQELHDNPSEAMIAACPWWAIEAGYEGWGDHDLVATKTLRAMLSKALEE